MSPELEWQDLLVFGLLDFHRMQRLSFHLGKHSDLEFAELVDHHRMIRLLGSLRLVQGFHKIPGQQSSVGPGLVH